MSFYDFINKLLGINVKHQDSLPSSREDDRPGRSDPDEFRYPNWNWDDDVRIRPPSSPFGRIFSDPLELHKFFEHQVEEFIRSFSMLDPPGMFADEMMPREGSLRDQYLKPGYDKADKNRQDTDLDDKIRAGELDKILGSKPSPEPDSSKRIVISIPGVQINLYGTTTMSQTICKPDGKVETHCTVWDNKGTTTMNQTICKPDGKVETHRTVWDNKGNTETTVTRQKGDQSYTATIHKDASGTEKRTENLYNLKEEDLDAFKKKW